MDILETSFSMGVEENTLAIRKVKGTPEEVDHYLAVTRGEMIASSTGSAVAKQSSRH